MPSKARLDFLAAAMPLSQRDIPPTENLSIINSGSTSGSEWYTPAARTPFLPHMLNLPVYGATDRQRKSVNGKIRTARFIGSLWDAADRTQRKSPAFLSFLVQCGGTTKAKVRGTETARLWRNKNLAEFLGVAYTSDAKLARGLCEKLPRLEPGAATKLLRTPTGVTHYPNFYHDAALRFVRRYSSPVARAFERVSRVERAPEEKAFGVASMIEALGKIKSRASWLSPFNALTPALACLDPQRRFPS